MSILVFGSINMDLVTRSPHLPQPGETLIGHSFTTVPGGKGANQAVAAARLGIPTRMVGRVGNDAFGQELLQQLDRDGIQIEDILVDESVSSGVATIAIDDHGENHIIVIPGANGQVNQTDVDRLQPRLSAASILLLQLEIPLTAVIAAAQAARAAHVTVILDPAPAIDRLPDDLYQAIDILTPNQVEASQLVGFAVTDVASAMQAVTVLHQRGVANVMIKLGQQGAFCSTPGHQALVPPFPVTAIDTVAAGDAFNGGLAAGLAEGQTFPQACLQAAATAAMTVTRSGAQSAMPTREELEDFLQMQW